MLYTEKPKATALLLMEKSINVFLFVICSNKSVHRLIFCITNSFDCYSDNCNYQYLN